MDINAMSEIPQTPPFINKYIHYKEGIYKSALEMSFVNGKIPAIEAAFADDSVAKKVCYMLATSHEYKKPNTENSIAFVKNYRWEEDVMGLKAIQGINKPVDAEKVASMVKSGRPISPLIVVDQINGIRPQSRGKGILIDGHHRFESEQEKGSSTAPVYRGFYTGEDSLTKQTLLPKFPTNRRLSFAFDYDGTIIDRNGKPIEKTVEAMKRCYRKGHLVIIWTCRSGRLAADAEATLKKFRIPYHSFNHNPDFNTGSPKMYADLTVDDRAISVSNIDDLLFADIPEWRKPNGR